MPTSATVLKMDDLKTLIREVPDFPQAGHSLLRHHHAAEGPGRACAA